MIDELKQIAIFAKTVDHGSFRAAAQVLRLSPSVVSYHVGQLEERLGTALLYRSTRKLSLTPAGEKLLIAAHAMIDAAQLGLQDVSFEAKQPSGTLRITMSAFFSQSVLLEKLGEFSLEHPRVELSIDFSDTRRDLISDGFDIAIRAGEMQDSTLKAQLLFEFNRCLVASPKYLKKHAIAKSPIDLNNWDWLELAPIWQKKTEFRKGKRRQLVQKKKARLSVNSIQAISQLACTGAGLAIIPEYLAKPRVAAGELEYLLSDWKLDPIKTFAVWPANIPKDSLIRLLINYLTSHRQQLAS